MIMMMKMMSDNFGAKNIEDIFSTTTLKIMTTCSLLISSFDIKILYYLIREVCIICLVLTHNSDQVREIYYVHELSDNKPLQFHPYPTYYNPTLNYLKNFSI